LLPENSAWPKSTWPPQNLTPRKSIFAADVFAGGAGGTRTPDPLLAKYTHTLTRTMPDVDSCPAVCSSPTCTIRDVSYRKRLQTWPGLGPGHSSDRCP